MSKSARHESVIDQVPGFRVVAMIDCHLLPQVREALAAFRPCSVLVSSAEVWGDGGTELSYKGQRLHCDRKVARVEIACTQPYVDRIVSAIHGLLQRTAAGHVVDDTLLVFPVFLAQAGAAEVAPARYAR